MRVARIKWMATIALLTATFALGQRPAMAVICTVDRVPAATLLVPYFQVDLKNKKGVDTLFSIDNTAANSVVTHVVIWSDLSVPVLNFNVYLTGYDVQTVDMREVLNGFLPQTASAGQDPIDTISPKGPLSQDINFASCSGTNPPDSIRNPALPPSKLSPEVVTHLANSLTGRASKLLSGSCAGFPHGDHIARGYVTMDTVNNCTAHFPDEAGYFASDVTDQNALTGEVFYTNGKDPVRAGSMVPIEADATNPATSTPGQYTFYGRYDNWTAADNREPLATAFDARFMSKVKNSSCKDDEQDRSSLFHSPSALIVWRDSKVDQHPFTCGSLPAWEPLGQEGIVIFDDQEHAQSTGALVPFPLETQLVPIGGSALPVSITAGWLYLNLNTTVAAVEFNPPVDPAAAQAYVAVIDDLPTKAHSSTNAGVEYPATALDSGCAASHFVP
jgi:hypothetical protein